MRWSVREGIPRLILPLPVARAPGATCYLNSLLQALYLTTEFREALYGAGTHRASVTDAGHGH